MNSDEFINNMLSMGFINNMLSIIHVGIVCTVSVLLCFLL
jgi:hypothetical protein